MRRPIFWAVYWQTRGCQFPDRGAVPPPGLRSLHSRSRSGNSSTASLPSRLPSSSSSASMAHGAGTVEHWQLWWEHQRGATTRRAGHANPKVGCHAHLLRSPSACCLSIQALTACRLPPQWSGGLIGSEELVPPGTSGSRGAGERQRIATTTSDAPLDLGSANGTGVYQPSPVRGHATHPARASHLQPSMLSAHHHTAEPLAPAHSSDVEHGFDVCVGARRGGQIYEGGWARVAAQFRRLPGKPPVRHGTANACGHTCCPVQLSGLLQRANGGGGKRGSGGGGGSGGSGGESQLIQRSPGGAVLPRFNGEIYGEVPGTYNPPVRAK